MQYIATRESERKYSFSEAYALGRSPAGGYFVPQELIAGGQPLMAKLLPLSFWERMAYLLQLFAPELDSQTCAAVCSQAFDPEQFSENPAQLQALNPYANREFALFLNQGPAAVYYDYLLSLEFALRQQLKAYSSQPQLYLSGASFAAQLSLATRFRQSAQAEDRLLLLTDNRLDEWQRSQLQQQLADVPKHKHLGVQVWGSGLEQERLLLELSRTALELAPWPAAYPQPQQAVCVTDGSSVLGPLLALMLLISALTDLKASEFYPAGQSLDIALPLHQLDFLLAALYAKEMDLGIDKIVLANTQVQAFSELLRQGKYEFGKKINFSQLRELELLWPVNLERLLFELSGRNATQTAQWCADLAAKHSFAVSKQSRLSWQEHVLALARDEKTVAKEMRMFYDSTDYLLDAGSIAAYSAWRQLRRGKRSQTNLVLLPILSDPRHGAEFSADAIFAKGYSKGRSTAVLIKEVSEEAGLPKFDLLPSTKKQYNYEILGKDEPNSVLLGKIADLCSVLPINTPKVELGVARPDEIESPGAFEE